MSLVKCSECKKEISNKSKVCIHCGSPVEKEGVGIFGVIVLTIIGGIVILIFLASQAPSSSSSSYSSSSNTYTPPPDVLEVQNFSCATEHGYMHVEGTVKNISNRSLKNVVVVGQYKTKDKTFITSSNALIDYNPILPGQSSPFKTLTSANPAFGYCVVDFKTFGGGTLRFSIKGSAQRILIKDIQRALKSKGYNPGSADGIMGSNTRRAIREYQAKIGIPVDGKATDALLAKLKKGK